MPKMTKSGRSSSSRKANTTKTTAPRVSRAKAEGEIKAKAPKAAPSYEDIARLAYLKWEQRGHAHGHDLEDWVAAETELRTQR